MTTLRYQWGEGPLRDGPAPPRATVAALWVHERCAWRCDVADVLVAWARWCALEVADQWDCPPQVRRHLQTGEGPPPMLPRRRQGFLDAGHQARTAARHAIQCQGLADARNAARHAIEAAIWITPLGLHERGRLRGVLISRRQEARSAQASQLRRLLLQRALPRDRWLLIDADEPVLCDALLEGGGC